MEKQLFIFLVVLLIKSTSVRCVIKTGDEPIVQGKEYGNVMLTTALGKLRGTYLTSSTGRIFYSFRGIRYAQPPVGELRFKPPQPIDQWNGIFDATKDGPMCPQPTVNLSDISEDCLRLNIYSHELPTDENRNIRKPVIVYLHPGGFYAVSGQSWNFAGPLYLMDRNIVLVTLNYRLGSLGFLSTGTKEAPGNNGLKDQAMALKWIKTHIARFGGDPNAITVMGYSAGAFSITLHMVSPMSRNLFNRAIVMSGSAVSQRRTPIDQRHLAKRQARLLNCSDENIPNMMKCLMTKDAVDFANTLEQMFEFGSGNPVLLFSPVIEPDFGQEMFLIEDPSKLYQRGRFMRIPIIAGITKDEFAFPAIAALKNSTLRTMLDTNFDKWAPVNFLFERNTQRSNEISAKLRDFYLGDSQLQMNQSLNGLAQIYADSLIGFGMHRFVHLAARFTKVYQYCFTYQGRYSHTYYPTDDKPYGVVHHDDLIYLLTGPFIAPVFKEEDPERITVERLTRMWAAFAYKGDPNRASDDYLRNIRWRPFGLRRQQYLEIGESLEMKDHLYTARYDVWKDLFPLEWSPQFQGRVNNESGEFTEDYPEPESSDKR